MKLLLVLSVLALHPLEQKGIEHLYNLEFREALQSFETLAREESSSPAGPHYVASTLWMEELTRRGGMTGETFLSSRYWTRTRKEPPSAELRQSFQAQVNETRRRAETILRKQSDEPEALYFLGATESVVAGFESTLNRSYFAAYRAGRRAANLHERLIESHPSYADGSLVRGAYEYTLATLPRSLKVLTFLLGIQGSKDEGIKLLERAARYGKRDYWGARLLLTVIMTREKRYSRALSLLEELERAFPRNPLFPAERGWVLMLRKDWTAARSVVETVRARQREGIPNFGKIPSSLLLLRIGESYLFQGAFQPALERFDEALNGSVTPEPLAAILHLRKGQTLDGLDRREEALREYHTTIRLNADTGSRRQASRHLKQPFRLEGG